MTLTRKPLDVRALCELDCGAPAHKGSPGRQGLVGRLLSIQSFHLREQLLHVLRLQRCAEHKGGGK